MVEEAQERVMRRLPCQSREGRGRGNEAILGAPHREEEDGGHGDAHARALGGKNDARPTGTGESCRDPTPGEGKKVVRGPRLVDG
jgi:hypothetical protein